jgi:Holliday junction resolvasome RuvABC endonuclease subunit
MDSVVLGVDLSLTGLGLVAVPTDWDLRWSRVARATLGMELSKGASARELAMRRRALCDDVARWASRRNVTHVWFEAYPVMGRVFNVDKLAELGGVFKDRLAEIGLHPEPVSNTTARKLLLGKLPPSDRKAVVVEMLRLLGAGFDDPDQADAFAVANYGLSELGAPCITVPLEEVTQVSNRPQKARRKTGGARGASRKWTDR